ncbi:MAG: hypothetical protein IK038_04410 [Bacteroidaceae bacterium]|nr:hypothetical protein [Bacteroidaceae bacterium]
MAALLKVQDINTNEITDSTVNEILIKRLVVFTQTAMDKPQKTESKQPKGPEPEKEPVMTSCPLFLPMF